MFYDLKIYSEFFITKYSTTLKNFLNQIEPEIGIRTKFPLSPKSAQVDSPHFFGKEDKTLFKNTSTWALSEGNFVRREFCPVIIILQEFILFETREI